MIWHCHRLSSTSFVMQGTKAIMKDVAKYLPGIGWSFLFMEYPLLKRDWKKDQDRLRKSCENLRDYPVNMMVSDGMEDHGEMRLLYHTIEGVGANILSG